MSGSLKYTDGAVKSRGGFVVVVGGVAGPAPPGGGGAGWAMAAVGAMAAAPTTAATDLMIVRRESVPPEEDVPVGMSDDSLRSLWVARVAPCPVHGEGSQASKLLKTFSTGDFQFRQVWEVV